MKKSIGMLLLSAALSASSGVFAQDSKPYKLYLVSTAHFDVQWNWTIRQSIDDYIRPTMTQNFWLFEHFPHYVFNFESALKYGWMKEYFPQDYEKVKEYVRAGRWNVVGSCWEASDPNMPSSESFFRNILLGQEFYKKEFGVKAKDIYLPDCFGFGYTLPTIAAHCGLIGFSTQKLQWRKNVFHGEMPKIDKPMEKRSMWDIPNTNKMPFPIGVWNGIDGSGLLAVLDGGGYGTSFFYDDISRSERLIKRAKLNPDGKVFAYYGVGDRGGSPTLPSVWSMEKSLTADGPLEVLPVTAQKLYEDYLPFDAHPDLPRYKGELTMDVHGVGCYTSQAMLKVFNRRSENLLDAAERASAAAEVLGGIVYPADELRDNWQRLITHQFHDDITGTSIPEAYTFSWNDHMVVQNRVADEITTAVGAVARTLNTKTGGIPVVVYNPMAVNRTELVSMTVPMASRPQGVRVSSPEGQVPAQLLSWNDGKAEILVAAKTAPMSWSVYDVKTGSGQKNALKVTDNSIENSIYRVTLDKNGDIASIFDKRYNKELVQEGKPFRLAVLTDNESKEYPAWEVFKKTIDGPSESVTSNVRTSVAERGPVRATIKVERDYNDSHIVQYISLTDGAMDDRIDIANEIDWKSKNAMLKAEFPTTVANEHTAYDLGIGYINRGVNKDCAFEVIGHQWADLTDEDNSYGVSVLNDSKYGWDKPDRSTIRLTLLNTPGCEGSFYHYQDHQDHGHHTFRYAVIGHKGSFIDSGIDAKAESFNQQLLAFTTDRHAGKNGKVFSFADIDNRQVSIMAVKKAEDGNGYIVRVNEQEGRDYDNATITFATEIESAQETNGIEEVMGNVNFSGNKLTFSGKAFQPRTFRVALRKNDMIDTPKSQFVDLNYNAVAFTPDEFNRVGNFDRRGNSLAAELMPEVVTSDNISFKVCNDPTIKDFIRANGDSITLPPHSDATKLYLLVTSVNGDRKTTFKVDGKEYPVTVPYYTDFFGQWGWDGESEGYLKEGSFGYVANHKHCAAKGNDSYNLVYLYKVCLDIAPDAKLLELPKDAGIAVFAATLTDDANHDTKAATEMRIIPKQTKAIEYTDEPMKYFNDRSGW